MSAVAGARSCRGRPCLEAAGGTRSANDTSVPVATDQDGFQCRDVGFARTIAWREIGCIGGNRTRQRGCSARSLLINCEVAAHDMSTGGHRAGIADAASLPGRS